MKQFREVITTVLAYMAFTWMVLSGLSLLYALWLWTIQKDIDNSLWLRFASLFIVTAVITVVIAFFTSPDEKK